MRKYTSTSACKYNKQDEFGEFVFLLLPPDHTYESEFYTVSQILFTVAEPVTLVYENGKKVLIPPYHLFHVKRNTRYKLLSESHSEVLILTFWKIEFVCNRNEIMRQLSVMQLKPMEPSPVEMKDPMSSFVESMKYYLVNSLCCPHLQEIKRRELSILFKNLYSIDDIGSILEELILNSQGFRSNVSNHIEAARTVGELALLCGYSLKTLERLFKEHYGITPYKWMLNYKMDRMKELMSDNNIPIKMVVSSLGFTSASHLNTFCKKHFGMTPSVLRNHLINES